MLWFVLIIRSKVEYKTSKYTWHIEQVPFSPPLNSSSFAARKSLCLTLSPLASLQLNEAYVTLTVWRDRSLTPRMKESVLQFGSITVLFSKIAPLVLHPMPLYIVFEAFHAHDLESATCYANKLSSNWIGIFHFELSREIFLFFKNPRQGHTFHFITLHFGRSNV